MSNKEVSNKVILTYTELLEEKARLQNLLKIQREQIQTDITALKNELKPATKVINFFGKVGETTRSNPLVGFAVGMGTDILLRKFIFKKVGWAAKLVLPFLVRNASSRLLGNTRTTLVKKLLSKIKKN